MTHISKKISSFRFLFTGGWIAIKTAFLGCIFFVLLNFVILTIITFWQNGIQTIELISSDFLSILFLIPAFIFKAILFSFTPSFLGGILLARLLTRKNYNRSIMMYGKLGLGSIIGAFVGLVLTSLFLLDLDSFARMHNRGIGYDLLSSLPTYLTYAAEIILISTIAGKRIEGQLRKELDNVTSNTMA